MEVVWNNPRPNRTLHRASLWEVVARDGTTMVISADEVQAMAGRRMGEKLDSDANGLENAFSLYFCF